LYVSPNLLLRNGIPGQFPETATPTRALIFMLPT
jgi:hypothetical protein